MATQSTIHYSGRPGQGRRFFAGAAVVTALLALPPAAGAQACPPERLVAAHPGFEMFVCYGGNCRIAVREEGALRHVFTVEPRVRGVVPDGPADGRLRDGDVIVAVDGRLITTRAGGERMASLPPYQPVTFRVRRDGREMDVTLTPMAACHRPGISISANPRTEAEARAWVRRQMADDPAVAPATPSGVTPVAGHVDFALALACGACGWRRVNGHMEFVTAVDPVVAGVLPGGPGAAAGVQVGDTLVSLEGLPLTGTVPDSVWVSLASGRPVRIEV